MSIIFQLSTNNYSNDRFNVKKALSHMETLCQAWNGYQLSEPEEIAGWTFFKLKLEAPLHEEIQKEFADMIGKYSRWSKPEEKFRKFMEDYFLARGCTVKVKMTD